MLSSPQVLARLLLLLTVACCSAMAHAAERTKPEGAVELRDPATKAVVGWYDPTKKVLVFPAKNMGIPRAQVNRVSAKDFVRLRKLSQDVERGSLKAMKPPPRMQTVTGRPATATVICDGVVLDGNLPSGAVGGGSSDKCVGLCWDMAEGGARCHGCCVPIAGDACYCYESCSDSMSSTAKQ